MSYATFASVTSLGFEVDAGEQTKFDSLLLPAASRLIDRACEVADGFFEAAAGLASARTFYGDGTDFLLLPPFVGGSVSGVVLPAGYAALGASDYYEAREVRNFYLVRQYGTTRLSLADAGGWFARGVIPLWPVGPFDLVTNNFYPHARGAGWPKGVAVAVTARWGWAAIPAEVAQATVEMALRLWRQTDLAGAKVSDVEGQGELPALGPIAKLVVDKYRERRAPVFA